jgi:hypothetical protein
MFKLGEGQFVYRTDIVFFYKMLHFSLAVLEDKKLHETSRNEPMLKGAYKIIDKNPLNFVI